jgi:hypothetical protein
MNRDLMSSWAWEEMKGAELNDERQRGNLVRMCLHLAEQTGQSFSSACGHAVRKSAWRLFSQQDISLLSGHFLATGSRVSSHDFIVIAEDATDVSYLGHKASKGLGHLGGNPGVLGLCMHSCLALSAEGEPLGLLSQHIWAPTDQGRDRKEYTYPIEEKESFRWVKMLDDINRRLKGYEGRALIVCDREGDFYEHFAWQSRLDLLVRAHHLHRNVVYLGKKMKLGRAVKRLPAIGRIEIEVNQADPQTGHIEPYAAIMEISFGSIRLPASDMRKGKEIELSVVVSRQVNAEKGSEPLEWILLTSMKVESFEEAKEMVRCYGLRWTIERFHYVLKQGLRIERLQFDTFTRLSHALEVCSVVAYRLLWMTYYPRHKPDAPAEILFGKEEIRILEKETKKKPLPQARQS